MNITIDSLDQGQWLIFWLILSAVFGLAIGSFLNVVIWRVPSKLSLSQDGSVCPKCREQIKTKDNIPLLSYLLLKGKCRKCKTKISIQYPVVEILTSAIWVVTTWRVGIHLYTIGFLLFFSALIALSVIVYFLFLFAIWFSSNGKAMGFGDVKLVFFLGFAMGFYGFLVSYIGLLISFLLGATIGLMLMTITKSGRKMKIPFGPFLAAGTIIAILCAPVLSHIIELPNA